MKNNINLNEEDKAKLEDIIDRVLMDTQPTPALFELISLIKTILQVQ